MPVWRQKRDPPASALHSFLQRAGRCPSGQKCEAESPTGILGTWLRLAERADLSVRALRNIESDRTKYPHQVPAPGVVAAPRRCTGTSGRGARRGGSSGWVSGQRPARRHKRPHLSAIGGRDLAPPPRQLGGWGAGISRSRGEHVLLAAAAAWAPTGPRAGAAVLAGQARTSTAFTRTGLIVTLTRACPGGSMARRSAPYLAPTRSANE
jgi:hypothetical protein